MVRQQQEIINDGRYSQIELAGSPDFVKLAEAYGVKGLRARTKTEAIRVWKEAIRVWKEAMETDGPMLVKFVVPKFENVYPMVLSGTTIDQLIMGEFE